MRFIDEVTIAVESGAGGAGCVSFRREKFVPRGGPDGGDGGKGGDVVLVADPQGHTLLDFRYQRRYAAKRGQPGQGKQMSGKQAADLELRVPVGTMVFDASDQRLIVDLDQPEQRYVVARGGRGGLGNQHFATSRRQAPRHAQPGEAGQQLELRLELKLLADLGLIGFPNAGKSTLISALSQARPKVADYPFTTLVPHLGVVRASEDRSYTLVDIPGLIPGASQGSGMGIEFLKHIERCRALVHLLDASTFLDDGTDRDPIRDFDTLQAELAAFHPDLLKKPQLVVLNKADLNVPEEKMAPMLAHFAAIGQTLHSISAATGQGLEQLKYRMEAYALSSD